MTSPSQLSQYSEFYHSNEKFPSLVREMVKLKNKGMDPYFYVLSLFPTADDFPLIWENNTLKGIESKTIRQFCRLMAYDIADDKLKNRQHILDKLYGTDPRYKIPNLKFLRDSWCAYKRTKMLEREAVEKEEIQNNIVRVCLNIINKDDDENS
ncbi:MAG: hypothetical protein Sylvanvirus12_16 [Sylvanvirus sp.]|uniref:Uncharacterized protein n=1 Tax=Sylvanvirus sp. TaxID=2487774 RepID=A0A3G5AJI8_9VIRU|nr:MAG: hypothetical protein Sylvanvirus12_16 [Sylvanvirus sp.]